MGQSLVEVSPARIILGERSVVRLIHFFGTNRDQKWYRGFLGEIKLSASEKPTTRSYPKPTNSS